MPTVRVVKLHFAEKCESTCKKNSSDKETAPSGCSKEKCFLNLNFNPGQFIVQQIQKISLKRLTDFEKNNNLSYKKVFISNYKNTIWHPPKSSFLCRET